MGVYERPLSLTTTTIRRSAWTAMLFSASQAMPPVRAPSPITETTVRFSPRSRKALASPSPQLSEVEACEFSTQSCSDSAREG